MPEQGLLGVESVLIAQIASRFASQVSKLEVLAGDPSILAGLLKSATQLGLGIFWSRLSIPPFTQLMLKALMAAWQFELAQKS